MSGSGAQGVFDEMCAAFERLDVPAFLALLDDDVTAHFPYLPDPYPTRCHGRDDVAWVFALVDQLFSEFAWASREPILTTDPDLLVARASSIAKLVNGDEYTNDYVFFIRARGGKIVEYREYFDTTRLLAALAALPA